MATRAFYSAALVVIRLGASPRQRAIVISGNESGGLDLQDASQDVVEGNYVGTNSSSDEAVPNSNGGFILIGESDNAIGGLVLTDGSDNTVGGTVAAAANVISGNQALVSEWPMRPRTSWKGTRLAQTRRGTKLCRILAMAWTLVEEATTRSAASTRLRNVISGNQGDGYGIGMADETGDVVEGNVIGTDSSGDEALPNTGDGLDLGGGSDNTIGGTDAATANVMISGNQGAGIVMDDETQDVVEGNYVGPSSSGDEAIPNSDGGLILTDEGTTPSVAQSRPPRMSFPGTKTMGSACTAKSRMPVEGNFIGTEVSGNGALPNTLSGLSLSGGSDNTIGGTAAAGATSSPE